MRSTGTGGKSFAKPPAGAQPKKKISEILEDETKKMVQFRSGLKRQEERLKELQEVVAKTKPKEQKQGWGNASKDVPLRGYGKFVLEKGRSKPSSSSGSRKILKDPNGENMIGIKTKKGSTSKAKPVAVPEEKKPTVPEEKKSAAPKAFPEVDKFLEEIGMQKYRDVFLANGFEDLETILELREDDFSIMNIPLGHKLKMMKRIKELKPPEAKPQPQTQAQLHGIQKAAETDKSVDEERPAGQTKPETKKGERKKSVRFGESAVIIEIARDGDTVCTYENNKENMKENVKREKVKKTETADEGMGSSPKNSGGDSVVFLKASEEKESCWSCYKLFVKSKGYVDKLSGRVFTSLVSAQEYCDESCFKRYAEMNQMGCGMEECGKKFMKANGVLSEGKWFCSQACSEAHAKSALKGLDFVATRVEDEKGNANEHEEEAKAEKGAEKEADSTMLR